MKYITQILLLVLLLTACRTSRKTSSTAVIQKDSVAKTEQTQSSKVVYRDRIKIIKDTVIKIKERTVRDTIKAADQELPKTKDGKSHPVYREKTADSVTAWINILPGGDIEFGCKADALLLEVENLVYEKDHLVAKYDSVVRLLYLERHSKEETTESEVVKQPTWFGRYWPLILVVVIVVLIYIFRNVLKKWL